MGKKAAKPEKPKEQAKANVRKLIKKGKVKSKCCQSKPRCKKCPIRALKKAQKDLARAA